MTSAIGRAPVYTILFIFFLSILPVNAQNEIQIVVAKDGSGDYKTIREALDACRAFQQYQQTIYIKNGVYREKLHIDSFLTNVRLLGESREKTIISFDDFAGRENMGTFRSYTLKITGDGTVLENLTIENTAGRVGQAVALHVEGDRCKIIDCKILGNQDTLYAAGENSRQYYKNCYIDGTTDFIFGSATAIFDDCTIHSKKESYITAANTPQNRDFGYVFRNCKLTAEDSIKLVYLGRPWRDYAKVVFLNCDMGKYIRAEGWHNWSRPEREKTAFYAEYNCFGAGSATENRVKWSHQLSDEEAKKYTYENIYNRCSKWILTEKE